VKFLVTLLLALVLLTFEMVFVQALGLSITRIDVTVVLIAFLSLRATTTEGAISSFAVGYLLDLMSGQPTGLYTFLGVLVFLGGRLVGSVIEVRSRGRFALFAMGADVTHVLLASFFTWLTTREGGMLSALTSLPLQVGLTGLAALLLHPLLKRLEAGDRAPAGLLR
jgi:hypothetical protein